MVDNKKILPAIYYNASEITFKNFEYYFKHPLSRMFVATFIIFCNFLVLAEDPVAHSGAETRIPIIGNALTFVFARYPSSVGGSIVKVICWVLSVLLGMFVGRNYIHHKLLRDRLHVHMFAPGTDNGTWMVMFFTSLIFLAIGSVVYNGILSAILEDWETYKITEYMNISNITFMRLAASCTWVADFLTVFMVWDLICQERSSYPEWMFKFRQWWPANRVKTFWILVPLVSAAVSVVVGVNALNWERIKMEGMSSSSEVSRALLASFITGLDLLIVAQDWEFPLFDSGQEVKIVGLELEQIRFQWAGSRVRVTGKWFNYGIVFMVMLFDLNMLKAQVLYVPFEFGQYVDPATDHIYTVSDPAILHIVDTDLAEAERLLTWDNRHAYALNGTDAPVHSKYIGASRGVMFCAVLPALTCIALFTHSALQGESTSGRSAKQVHLDAIQAAAKAEGDAAALQDRARRATGRTRLKLLYEYHQAQVRAAFLAGKAKTAQGRVEKLSQRSSILVPEDPSNNNRSPAAPPPRPLEDPAQITAGTDEAAA